MLSKFIINVTYFIPLHSVYAFKSKYIPQKTLHNPELQNHSISGKSRI